jgi:AcrR family transcriptional regulator
MALDETQAQDPKDGGPETVDVAMPLPRGRHSLSRQAVTDSQRARIIEAMIGAAAERGYAETRVIDVIERAGVSRKTFYELFDDREDCFLAAYDHVFGRLLEAASEGYEHQGSGAPWAERIRAGLEAFLTLIAEWPEAARFAIIEVLAAGPHALVRRDAAIRQFTQFIDAGRAEAKIELPGMTSVAIVGGVYELLYSEILHGATAHLPARLPDVIYWITAPFLGPERAAEERERARQTAR